MSYETFMAKRNLGDRLSNAKGPELIRQTFPTRKGCRGQDGNDDKRQHGGFGQYSFQRIWTLQTLMCFRLIVMPHGLNLASRSSYHSEPPPASSRGKGPRHEHELSTCVPGSLFRPLPTVRKAEVKFPLA
jgi:hypothetical protein